MGRRLFVQPWRAARRRIAAQAVRQRYELRGGGELVVKLLPAQLDYDRSAMNSQVSEGVSLLYLQLLQDAAVRAMNTAGRLFLIRVLLTIVLLALAIGVVRTEEQFGLSGLNFELDLWVLLVAVAVLGLVLLVFDVAHYERGHRLAWRVVRLYEGLGFGAPRAEWNSPDSPFGLPYAAAFPLDALWSRWFTYRRVAVIGTTLATCALFLAQVLVLRRLGHDFGWTLPVCVFAVVPLTTLVVGLGRVVAFRRAAGRGEKPYF